MFAIIRKPLVDFIPYYITIQQIIFRKNGKKIQTLIKSTNRPIENYFVVVLKISYMFINIYKYLQGFLNCDGLYMNWCNGCNRFNSCSGHLYSANIMDIP